MFGIDFQFKAVFGGGGGGFLNWVGIPICTSDLNKNNLISKSLTFPICWTVLLKGLFVKWAQNRNNFK